MQIILYFLVSLLAFIILVVFSLIVYRIYMQKKIIRKSNLQKSSKGYCSVEMVTIGGIKQSILIQANDKSKPILLVLHGGSGMPFPGVSCREVENIYQITTSNLIEKNAFGQ